MTLTRDLSCQVCGHDRFVHADVIWPELVRQWQLGPDEVAYINVQQGTRCERCRANVRSQALARALLGVLEWPGTLEAYVTSLPHPSPRLLEINEAGALTPWLSRLRTHRLVRFPEHDMRALPFADGSFDLVVHSDTLEHVPGPETALAECRRVLAAPGACVFTVPIVVGRLTRSRAGLPDSYHGDPGCRESDHLVQTEFGSDAWTAVLRAGFDACGIVPYRYPAGIALVGRRGPAD